MISINNTKQYPLIGLVFLFLISSCSTGKKLEDNRTIDIIPRSEWTANEPRPYKEHVPERITIHHEGTKLEADADAARHIKNVQVWGMGKDRNWADIPYHFLIAPDGKIYEGRNVYTVGETNTEYDPTGHLLITMLGNFEVQEVPEAQLNSLAGLIAHCSQKYKLPVASLASHKDYSKQTTCPGKNLYQYLQDGSLKKMVGKIFQ